MDETPGKKRSLALGGGKTRWLGSLVVTWISLAQIPSAGATITDLIKGLKGPAVPQAPHSLGEGKPRSVLLNGFPIQLVSDTTSSSQQDVIGFYRDFFLREANSTHTQLALQSIGDDASFLLGAGSPSLTGKDLTETGVLALLTGRPLRLVYAQRMGDRTDYVAAWSEKPLSAQIFALDPEKDAPGEDIPSIPRPKGKRILSFSEPATGYATASYRTMTPAAEAFRQTLDMLDAAGYVQDARLQKLTEQPALTAVSPRFVAHLSNRARELLLTVRQEKRRVSTLIVLTSKPR